MVTPRAQAGDRWECRVVFGGARLEVGGALPVDTSQAQVVQLMVDGVTALSRQLADEVAHQKRMAEEALDDE